MKSACNYKYLIALFGILAITSCERELEDLEPATFPTTAEVFIDGFSGGLEYAAFGGSDVTAFQVDTEVRFRGTSSMRFEVPDFESPTGAFAGGVFFVEGGRDLSGYTALTFWMRATRSANINELGIGNDLGANEYVATITNVPVNTNWQKYYIPIPDPSKLTQERGMLWYAEGPEDEEGYTFWIDEVRYENLGTITPVGSTIIYNGGNSTVTAENGATFDVVGSSQFNLPEGVDISVATAPAYFDFMSSNTDVATVAESGQVTVVG
ncbi:MAG: carbohydrate binding domain-containing protein, partial [Bacteroidota bacterium]